MISEDALCKIQLITIIMGQNIIPGTLSHDSRHKSRSEIIDSPQSCEGQGDADYPWSRIGDRPH